ncbi:MAG: hypothetical protein QNJ51_23890 [Calothrix sp. MO_167.B12]|nr:hypothetical protein [Calothrix sp. MO_167.B12]
MSDKPSVSLSYSGHAARFLDARRAIHTYHIILAIDDIFRTAPPYEPYLK